jgi:hypothetical protein
MKISGPDRYSLTFDAKAFQVCCPLGSPNFSGKSRSKLPKLYIISVEERPIYVGVTKQEMRSRLRLGWSADGSSGYYGYAWRHSLKQAMLDIYYHEDPPAENIMLPIETVEAEIVYLIREAGQWPQFQTEIHFHPSNAEHRKVAADIFSRYRR